MYQFKQGAWPTSPEFVFRSMPESPDVLHLMKHWVDLVNEGGPDCEGATTPRELPPALREAFIRAGSTPDQVDNMCIYPKDVGLPRPNEQGGHTLDVKVSWKPGYVDIEAVVDGDS